MDPYFWLTHHIHKIFENRQKNKVLLFNESFKLKLFVFIYLFKIVRRDFAQLLIEAQDQDVEVERSLDKIELDKLNLEKRMSFDVKI